MKLLILPAALLLAVSCGQPAPKESLSLVGTWELFSATSTANDTTVSTFNPKVKMIKVINPTHFAFMSHDVSGAADSVAAKFTAGGGRYTLTDSTYTEYLDYFVDRKWENLKFDFTVSLHGDTLVQRGVEKNEAAGVDHIIVEQYKKVNK